MSVWDPGTDDLISSSNVSPAPTYGTHSDPRVLAPDAQGLPILGMRSVSSAAGSTASSCPTWPAS